MQIDRERDFYTYTVSVASLAAAASTSTSFQIDTDSNFILQKMTYTVDLAGAAVTSGAKIVPLVTLQITDGGSSRQMFSQATPIPSIIGDGNEPFILPAPRVFVAASTIQLSFVNYSAATTYTHLYLSFIGQKVYRFEGKR